jgi:hypothetical protein
MWADAHDTALMVGLQWARTASGVERQDLPFQTAAYAGQPVFPIATQALIDEHDVATPPE